ncbi:MAG: S1 RNA-binding domain-containing protein [Acutalibacteraceae bacterium]|nr:S1 RNA-binding domain-containing protein [Oscillospiraceae bacterium]
MTKFMPEGSLISTKENLSIMTSKAFLKEAFYSRKIIEARAVMCDREHNLHVDLGVMKGIIPREEGAIGISDGTVRDIAVISRVNKPVAFRITDFTQDESGHTVAILSRKQVQEDCIKEYISHLVPGDVINAKVTHMESFGVFADIGAGVSALLPIDSISVSRIPHPSVRFRTGDDIKAVVKCVDSEGRITLSFKELLGTWEQNAGEFSAGETVPGIIRSVEKYGVFVELKPNLAGLAEYVPDVRPGQHASVYVKSLIPERMKIKLIIVDSFDAEYPESAVEYFTQAEHIDRWVYSPECCEKVIETVFDTREETESA